MIDMTSHPRRRDAIFSQRAGATVMLLDRETGRYYMLNEVAGRIWELSDGTRDVAEIVTALCEEYDAPAERIATDALTILRDVSAENLVFVLEPAGEEPLAPAAGV